MARGRKISTISKQRVESEISAARPTSRGNNNYEYANERAAGYDRLANSGRNAVGQYTGKNTRNSQKTVARGIRKESISKSQNNYNYDATREDAAAQHNARYRDIRTAMGLSAG